MLNNWLACQERNPCKYAFKVIDVTEIEEPEKNIIEYISEEILKSYRDLEYYKFMYSSTTASELAKYIGKYVLPSDASTLTKNVFQGDFGEILASLIVSYFYNLNVPLKKLKWKFNNNRALFCTDMVAHNNDDDITDLYYYEVKTRLGIRKESVSGESNYISVIAYKSLQQEQSVPNDSIADFLSKYYFDKHEYAKSKQYGNIVKNPENYKKNFELFFIIEKSKYLEDIFQELDDLPPSLNPLNITVVLINNLGRLVATVKANAVNSAINYVFP